MKKNINERMPPGWKKETIKPKYWHEWGGEKRGFVSTFAYDEWGDYHFTGYYPSEVKSQLIFLNPFS